MATFAESEVARLKLDIENAQDEIRRYTERAQDPNLNTIQRKSAERNLVYWQNKLTQLQTELAAAEQKASQQTATPPDSQTAAQDAQAAAPPPSAPTAVPPQTAAADGQVTTPPPVTTPSNAVVPPTTDSGGGDSGTNAPTRSLTQTQATSNQFVNAQGQAIGIPLPAETGQQGTIQRNSEDGSLYDAGPLAAPTAPGVGAQDDATSSSYGGGSAAEQTAINAALSEQGTVRGTLSTSSESLLITPKPNVLDRFASYTYRASWYLMTPEQYQQLVVSKKKQVNGYMLLVQSGGAPPNVGGAKGASGSNNQAIAADAAIGGFGAGVQPTTIPTGNDADAGRNPFFPDDFYIDSITIENLPIGAGSRVAHAIRKMSFTVVEPANITLLDRLYEAVQDFMPASGQNQAINYTAVTYLMVIRFYGYDENGNLVTNIGAPDSSGKSDPNAVIEKFIPFKIAQCQWEVSNSLVTYKIETLSPGLIIGAGTRRGTIPYDLQLSAKTIGQLLGSDSQFSTNSAPESAPGASTTTGDVARADRGQTATNPQTADAAATTNKTLTQGLMGAMNQFQQDLVKQGIYEYADTYKLVFANGGPGGGGKAIEKARLIPPGTKVDKRNLPTAPPGTVSTLSADMQKLFSDVTSRNYSITAGMQLVQAIDMAIRNSDYVYAQQQKFFNEDNDPSTDAEQTQNSAGKEVTWYNIDFEAVPKAGQYDRKRNDFAYDITFKINTYRPVNFASNFFPLNRFRGVHKKYDYWFTGQNTSVLEYKETLNNLYNLTISGSALADNLAKRQAFTSSMRDQPFFAFQSASNESRQGVSGKENEPGANLAEYLYDPVGLAEGKLKIVGDPAWIQQGSFTTNADLEGFGFSPFWPDGTINFDAQEILFEVAWQRPPDYNLNTGLADPYANSSKRQPVQSRVYTAKKITSEFTKGRFTQNIEGKLYFFMKPNASNKAPSAPTPKVSQVEDNRPTDTASDGSFEALERARLARGAPQLPQTAAAATAAATAAVPSLRGRLADVTGAIGAAAGLLKPAIPGLGLVAPLLGGVTRSLGLSSPNVQPAPPPGEPTSSTGTSLAVGDPFVPPGALTSVPDDNSFDRLESARLGRRVVQAVQSTPQDINRDN